MTKETDCRINKDIIKKVIEFGRILEEGGTPVEKLVIFGSHAKNTAREYSDIDVCVVSPKFGKDSIDELTFLSREGRKVNCRIEAHPFSPNGFMEMESPLVWEIHKHGFEVKPSGKNGGFTINKLTVD